MEHIFEKHVNQKDDNITKVSLPVASRWRKRGEQQASLLHESQWELRSKSHICGGLYKLSTPIILITIHTIFMFKVMDMDKVMK